MTENTALLDAFNRRVLSSRPDYKAQELLSLLTTSARSFAWPIAGKKGTLLDIGSSSGDFARLFVDSYSGWSTTLVDYVPAAKDACASKGLTDFHLIDLEEEAGKLKDLSTPFKIVTCFNTLKYLPNAPEVIGQMIEAAAPNSLLVFNLNAHNSGQVKTDRFVLEYERTRCETIVYTHPLRDIMQFVESRDSRNVTPVLRHSRMAESRNILATKSNMVFALEKR